MYEGSIEQRFDRLSLVSRQSNSARSSSDSIQRREVQLEFYDYIIQQFDRLSQTPLSEQRPGHFDSVLAKLRKLREGITAADIYDDFAVNVYEKSVDIALLARNFPELLKSLVHLLGTVYPDASQTIQTCLECSSKSDPSKKDETDEWVQVPAGRAVCGTPSAQPECDDADDILWEANVDDTKEEDDVPWDAKVDDINKEDNVTRDANIHDVPLSAHRPVPAPFSSHEKTLICKFCRKAVNLNSYWIRQPEVSAFMILYMACYAVDSRRCCGDPQRIMDFYRKLPPAIQDSAAVPRAMKVFKALWSNLDYVGFLECWRIATYQERVIVEPHMFVGT
ncbi:hypothetical protein DFS34DRAFT_692376 [Phlyctochytrium arcticum]|nr:hypothetical protein DFS34DRAFT_692376 [Phlyctochytrium arcticum]